MPDRRRDRQPNQGRTFLTLLAVVPYFFAALWQALRRGASRVLQVRRLGAADKRTARVMRESDSVPVQAALLAAGMCALWKALAREKLSGLRARSLRAGRRAAPRTRRLNPFVFVAGAMAVTAVAVFFSLYTTATTVSYNGTPLEIVDSAETARRVAARVEGVTAKTLGSAFQISEEALHYSTGLVQRSALNEGAEEALEEELTREIGLVTYGYSLYVDGEKIGATVYEGALEDLLDQIRQLYVSEDTLSVDFVEDVRIEEGYLPTESLTNLGRIAEVLNSTKEGEVTYTVVKGDTWGQIAKDHDMTSAELELLNPGYDINKIQIGDVLILSNAVSYLTVKVTERQNYVDQVAYDISYVDDGSMYQGDERVLSRGAFGSADIVADVVFVNGVETERTVISSVMLTAPVTEQRARGTKERPSWFPTGSFRWPASGPITSRFGYRNTGIRGASTYHQGIDIGAHYGAPIYAADGGTVVTAGWMGAGGYTVVIDHGNGYVTYYEHCSSFLVSAGAHVYKGQQIARVGSSGVASGPHCHFGIKRNGTFVNPLNYLP